MENKELSIDEQIEITEKVKEDMFKGFYGDIGLCCYFISTICDKCLITLSNYGEISDYIPLFKYENALNFNVSGNVSSYWWSKAPYDYTNRLKFLNWILDELKKQKNHGK